MKAVVYENTHEITVEHACHPKIINPRFVNLKFIPAKSFVNNILFYGLHTKSENSLAIKLKKSCQMIQESAKAEIMTPHKLNLEHAPETYQFFNYVK